MLITLFTYYALLFTHLGNYYHGGGPADLILIDAAAVVGAFLSLEIIRLEKSLLIKVTTALFGIPLGLFSLASLWFAIKRVVLT